MRSIAKTGSLGMPLVRKRRKIRRFPTPGTIRSRMLIGSSTTFLTATITSPRLAQVRRKFGESQGGIRTLGKASAFGSRDDAAAENHIGAARVEKDGRLPGAAARTGASNVRRPLLP